MKKSKQTPVYAIDKYGLLYQTNKPLSEKDKSLINKIKQSLSLKKK